MNATISWPAHARDVLKGSGLRRGGARAAVIDILGKQACARSAQEIEDALRLAHRRVGRASIYRALDVLLEHGLIARVEVGQGMARYEPLLPGGDHHHHVVCRLCGTLAAFDDDELERAIERVAERLGLDAAEHEVLLRGTCRSCS